MMWSKQEIERYKRQVILPEMGEEGQLRLKKAKVLVVGAGGLGNIVCAYLAAAGVGEITIVDHDTIESSNLQRQVMYTKNDIGAFKAEQLSIRLFRLNEFGKYHFFNQQFTEGNCIELSENQDLILDCVDQLGVRYIMNDIAVKKNIPLVYGAIHRFEGQVSVFNYKEGGSYRCAFPESKTMQKSPTCEEEGVIGVLPGIVGMYQAMEAIKVITGIGNVLSNKILMINLLKTEFVKMGYKRNKEQIEIALNRFNNLTSSRLNISWEELSSVLNTKKNCVLVDLQEDLGMNDWNGFPITHIPDYLFQDRITEFDTSHTIIVYCQKGVKSLWAMEVLKVLGYKSVYQITGGMTTVKA
ncbi:MAG: ThiF family adenylyltransferase [Salibacteraceae bacterium]